MKLNSLGLKISLIVTALIAVIIVLLITTVNRETTALVEDLVVNQTETTSNILRQSIEDLMDSAFETAERIARSAPIVNAIETMDMIALRDNLQYYTSGVDVVTLIDDRGSVIFQDIAGTAGGNASNQRTLSTVLTSGSGVRTIERGVVAGLSTSGSAVIRNANGETIAAVAVGHDLSFNRYVDNVKELGNCEATIFDGDTRLNTTIINDRGERVVGTALNNPNIEQLVLGQRQSYSSKIDLFGHTYAVNYSPLIAGNEVLGILFTGINIEQTMVNQRGKINQMIMIAVISGVASAILLFVFSIFMISMPLKKIGQFSNKIKTGDLGISTASSSTISISTSDEVGTLARTLEQAYAQLKGYVGEIQGKMKDLADGDLTSESTYEFQGDFTLIKDSINGIVANLNNTMGEINSATTQVASASKQIADGAQALAQGSTEQAASVQQLSASVSEIARKTKENADMAGQAASLAGNIKASAEKGSAQMDEMTSAVREINLASQNISKVIKVIDDIAFQTNILALNAAVEAARAGQHGKGFAVVAEEVRNLAAKSAEAAKDTGGLIANSMEKAELGARIADETASSLAEIVSGIIESNQIVAEIARSSEEQSVGIRQVNQGIDQVAQVVQQNSATAQQSAAASQEMSGQSAMLEGLITQFRLKDGGGMARQRLPAARKKQPEASQYSENNSVQSVGSGGFGKY